MPSYDTAVWLPNALVLTVLLGAWAVIRWRSRGMLSGLRWTGVALVPLALYFTGLLRMCWNIAIEISRFFTGFVWRPTVWLGLGLAVLSVVLIFLPGRLARWAPDDAPSTTSRPDSAGAGSAPRGSAGRTNAIDDELAEIEAILKRRGIE